MSSMVVTVVSGDEQWRRALERGLTTVGFQPLSIYEDEDLSPRRVAPLALLIDAEADPYDAVELASWLTVILGERCPPLVCLGELSAPCDDALFAGRAERPSDPNDLLHELEHLVPRLAGMASGYVARGEAAASDGSAPDDSATG